MTAKKELANWLEENKIIKEESKREDFFKNIHEELANKSGDELREGLIALKGAVTNLHSRVKAAAASDKSEIKVFPKSKEESELLKSLLQKMNIRFELG